MVRPGHQHAFCGLQRGRLGCVEQLQPVHVFQIERQTALRSIDFETVAVSASNAEAAGFKTADAAIREAGHRKRRIVHVALRREGVGHCR